MYQAMSLSDKGGVDFAELLEDMPDGEISDVDSDNNTDTDLNEDDHDPAEETTVGAVLCTQRHFT